MRKDVQNKDNIGLHHAELSREYHSKCQRATASGWLHPSILSGRRKGNLTEASSIQSSILHKDYCPRQPTAAYERSGWCARQVPRLAAETLLSQLNSARFKVQSGAEQPVLTLYLVAAT